MKDKWYADRRDLVKWSAILHLARGNGIATIIYVAFLRKISGLPKLLTNDGEVEMPALVWTHFRDVTQIANLGHAVGADIVVVADEFDPRLRRDYIRTVQDKIAKSALGPKIVFLDPDTGMAPTHPRAEHVRHDEIRLFWQQLLKDDWLVLYQHASRQPNWRRLRQSAFGKACGVPKAEVKAFWSPAIARDVVFFAARKS